MLSDPLTVATFGCLGRACHPAKNSILLGATHQKIIYLVLVDNVDVGIAFALAACRTRAGNGRHTLGLPTNEGRRRYSGSTEADGDGSGGFDEHGNGCKSMAVAIERGVAWWGGGADGGPFASIYSVNGF